LALAIALFLEFVSLLSCYFSGVWLALAITLFLESFSLLLVVFLEFGWL
jgi:hypothetical protein